MLFDSVVSVVFRPTFAEVFLHCLRANLTVMRGKERLTGSAMGWRSLKQYSCRNRMAFELKPSQQAEPVDFFSLVSVAEENFFAASTTVLSEMIQCQPMMMSYQQSVVVVSILGESQSID